MVVFTAVWRPLYFQELKKVILMYQELKKVILTFCFKEQKMMMGDTHF